ncbi:MAG: hypothetical protein JJV98_17330, partial [Desulfosarcina sp.]|nr:hypothetical protein [Desulfobacterales bacterium]
MTTKIVSSILVRITNVSFVARNFKTLASIVTVWLIVTAGGYLVYRLAASNANQTFYQMGAEAAQDLATKSRPFVLGDDVLPLNMLIQELKDLDALAFAAIVNHENLILSHTNAAMINQQYRPLDQTRMIETTAGTQIISGLTIDQQPTVAFFQTIRYADVPIGRAVVALAVSNLNSRIETMRRAYA